MIFLHHTPVNIFSFFKIEQLGVEWGEDQGNCGKPPGGYVLGEYLYRSVSLVYAQTDPKAL